jgi:plastocyanin
MVVMARSVDSKAPTRARGYLRWALAGLGLAMLLAVTGLMLLFVADYQVAGNGSPSPRERALWVIAHGDHVHYAVHVTAGRILSLCPCTRRAAATQYYRAKFHALTPHQRALLDSTAPHTVGQWATFVVAPVQVGLDWVGDGLAWVRGDRPVTLREVDIDGLDFQPAEITIPRGTTVLWRNTDDLAHTVTSARPGLFNSDWLAPEETFSLTFTQRGRYTYFGAVEGNDPRAHDLRGVIVVQ